MADTKIEWATKVWNPVTGCTKLSAGCKNCYAAAMFNRLAHNPNAKKYHGLVFADIQCHADDLPLPLRWKKPQRVFVNSMSDLFHDDVPFDFLDKVFAVMALNPRHTFMVLTKRPGRMMEYLSRPTVEVRIGLEALGICLAEKERTKGRSKVGSGVTIKASDINPGALSAWPLLNIWMGVTAENQEMADKRIPLLLQTPAAKRFVSIEPMLGPVDLEAVSFKHSEGFFGSALGWHHLPYCRRKELKDGRVYPSLDWVICGGESGPHARPMHPDWVRSLRDQCQDAGVPFFFKQWGEFVDLRQVKFSFQEWRDKTGKRFDDGLAVYRMGKKAAGRMLDGVEYMEFPV